MAENRATPESPAEAELKSAGGLTVAGADEAHAKDADVKHGEHKLGHTQGGGGNLTEIAAGQKRENDLA